MAGKAKVAIFLTEKGIVNSGTEYIARRQTQNARVDSYPQTWWCVVHTSPVTHRVVGVYPTANIVDPFKAP